MPTDNINQARSQNRLAAKAARQRVNDRELEREIYDAAVVQGLSQRQISQLVGSYSQASIQRILRRIADDPTRLDVKPAEIIDQRTAGIISTAQMMQKLLDSTYSVGHVVRIDGVATDAYIAGDWDSIQNAFFRGQLADDEFQRLADHQLRADLS